MAATHRLLEEMTLKISSNILKSGSPETLRLAESLFRA